MRGQSSRTTAPAEIARRGRWVQPGAQRGQPHLWMQYRCDVGFALVKVCQVTTSGGGSVEGVGLKAHALCIKVLLRVQYITSWANTYRHTTRTNGRFYTSALTTFLVYSFMRNSWLQMIVNRHRVGWGGLRYVERFSVHYHGWLALLMD